MNSNIGTTDRIIRIAVAVIIAVLFFTNQISGMAAIVLGALGIIFLLTGFLRFCPLYWPFGISTIKNKSNI